MESCQSLMAKTVGIHAGLRKKSCRRQHSD
nr:MAG TPA: hypothetical protein [Caudoviricetes sp.]